MPQLYTNVIKHPDGTEEIVGYAYGDGWVAMALYMDDIKFKTPEEAKEWWDKNHERFEKEETDDF